MHFVLQHEDDLLTVVDRLLALPDSDVSVTIPEGARLLSSEENFQLLKREMDAAGKRLRIFSHDPRARTLASRAGFALADQMTPLASFSGRRFSDILPPGRSQDSSGGRIGSGPQTIVRSANPQSPNSKFPEIGKVRQADADEEPISGGGQAASQSDAVTASASDEAIPLLEVYSDSAPKWRMPKISFPKFSAAGSGTKRWFEVILVISAAAVLFLVANEVLPVVDVRIQPRTEAISLSFPATVRVDTKSPEDIEGQKVSVQASDERTVAASGSETATARASGTLTIFNAYSSAPQSLVASTRFVSQDGKLFRLNETIVVPGTSVEGGQIKPSSIEAEVTADEAGPEYNIGPSSFSIPGFQGTPKYTAFTAKSTKAMTGGAKGVVKVVTADDVAKAQEGLPGAVSKKLADLFSKQVPNDLRILEDAIVENIAVTTDVTTGDRAEQVVAHAEGMRTVIAFRDADIQAKAQALLGERIPDTTEIVPGKLTLTPTVKSRDFDKGILKLDIAVGAQAAWKVDMDKVRQAIAGKREGEIRGWLASQEEIESATVRFSPFWVRSAPKNVKRIRIRVEISGEEQQGRVDQLLDRTAARLFH